MKAVVKSLAFLFITLQLPFGSQSIISRRFPILENVFNNHSSASSSLLNSFSNFSPWSSPNPKNNSRLSLALKSRHRRVMKHSCSLDLALEENKAQLIFTGRVEGVMNPEKMKPTDITSTALPTEASDLLYDIDEYGLTTPTGHNTHGNRTETGSVRMPVGKLKISSTSKSTNVLERQATNNEETSTSEETETKDGNNLFIGRRRRKREMKRGTLFSSDRFAARVRVKRVIKGDRGLENAVIVIDGFGKNRIGSKRFCMRRVRVKDTKIFMISVDNESGLMLAATPLPVTLSNLKKVNKLKKGKLYLTTIACDFSNAMKVRKKGQATFVRCICTKGQL